MVIKCMLFLVLITVFGMAISMPQNHVWDLDAYFEELDNLPNSMERVVGGNNVDANEYITYQVSMQYLSKEKHRHFCGGSIIAPNRILTAAHCMHGQNATKLSVVAGINNLKDESGSRSQVLSFVIHENYTELTTSDIAIVYIETPFQLDGKRIDKINAFGYESVGAKQPVTLTGWGSVRHFGNGFLARYPNELQKLNYETITNQQCKETYKQLTETEICALSHFGQGACNGDSGGPLVMFKDGKAQQVGVVSYGTVFCASNSPDAYTRTSIMEKWLTQYMA